MPTQFIATFRCDVTPPLGHPLCGGWIEPVRGIDDPLEIVGVVILGNGAPVVLAAVDWCGLRNDAHIVWRDALAAAAHTVPDHVAIQCVHPHNAPFAVDGTAIDRIGSGCPDFARFTILRSLCEPILGRLAESLKNPHRITHIGVGKGLVEQVASNRRVLGPDGRVKFTRTSSTRDPVSRAAPEGLIDPWLRTISLWDATTPVAALHYYATHPMSYYGDGRVTADFCGLARRKRQAENPSVHQVYFTGCAGNITAGKYNDGAKSNRAVLRDRIHTGMVTAWKDTQRHPIRDWKWKVQPVQLQPRREMNFQEDASLAKLRDDKASAAARCNAAMQVSWLRRLDKPTPITALDFDIATVLHLPGEPFIEYQLKAQQIRPTDFMCVAGYGDDGPGYLLTRDAYWQGGYEPTVALTSAESESILHSAMEQVLA